eukprot:s1753_g10.t1
MGLGFLGYLLTLALLVASQAGFNDDECDSLKPADGRDEDCALHVLQKATRLRNIEPFEGPVRLGREADVDAAPAEQMLGSDAEPLLGASAEISYSPPRSPTSDLKVLKKGNGLAPPSKATQYNGVAWPEMVFPGTGEMHVFTIGDAGGLLWEQYGDGTGLHVFPFIRPSCSINDMKQCFNETGDASGPCNEACGYVPGVDNQAQVVVAEQMKQRAAKTARRFSRHFCGTGVQYFLNVGDNFYPQGMNTGCGSPMNQIKEATKVQFTKAFDWVYSGPLNGKVWLSVLGNHDYGARQFNYAWDQQDLGFDVDIFMLDSNVMDAHGLDDRPGSNLCHRRFNAQDQPPTVQLLGDLPRSKNVRPGLEISGKGLHFLGTEKLNASKANWQIAVTHFPCGHKLPWYSKLRSNGLDLLVTGHIHEQQLQFLPGQLTCLVTGGGGGITSERSPQGDDSREYGFFDLTLSKSTIKLELEPAGWASIPVIPNWIPSGPIVQPGAVVPDAPKSEPQPAEQRSGVAAACSSNPQCAGLDGDCCPTPGGDGSAEGLVDVLDLRSSGWEDNKVATKKLEAPRKLGEFEGRSN